MVNYEYLKKIKTNGTLTVAIIDFLSNIDATYLRFKNGDIGEDRIFAVKSQFYRNPKPREDFRMT